MKRLIWMIFITLLAAGVAAQTKVVERSAKKVPGWLNTAVEDYLVVSVTAGSLAEESVDRDNRTYHSVGSQQCNGVQEEYSFGSQCEWKHRIFGCFYANIQDKVCQSSFSERDCPFQCRRNLLGESPGQSHETRSLLLF